MKRLSIQSGFFKALSLTFISALVMSAAIPAVSAAEIEEGFTSVTAEANNNKEDSSLPSSYNAKAAEEVGADELPLSYSAKDLGLVTDIKNQDYSDCWAYSGTEALETKLMKTGFAVTELSAEHANARNLIQSNGFGWQRTYSSGGWQCMFPGYLVSWQGAVETSLLGSFDLTSIKTCDEVSTDGVEYAVTGIRYLEDYDMVEIKEAIMSNGSVDTSYAATNNCFNTGSTAFYMPQSYNGSYSGHSICIVGWDDDYDKSNFKNSTGVLPANDGAWLVRNSWGDYNSLGGYFWISYEDKYIFGEKYSPSYTIDSVEPIQSGMSLLQNERYGATYSFDYVESNDVTFINRFTFTESTRIIDRVMFECQIVGAAYEVYYIPVDNSSPTSDKTEWQLIASGTLDYSGYISADTGNYTVPAGDGAIGVRITASDGNSQLGVGEWLTSSSKLIFKNDSNENDSFIYYDGKMTELLDWYKTNNNDDMGGTFVIKAITLESDDIMWGDVNLDGEITISDATAVQKYLVRLINLSDRQLENADADADGIVTISDATMLQKRVARII